MEIKNVCILVEFEDGECLAIARKDDETQLGFPGGKIDPGESPEQAAKREGFEELGVQIELLGLIYVDKDETNHITATYRAKLLGELPSLPVRGPEGTMITKESWDIVTNPKRSKFAEYNRQVQLRK